MIRPAAGALLAQARPSGTSAVEGYAAPAQQAVEVTRIVICNTTGTAAAASVFHDDAGGDTFNETTAHRYAKSVPANDAIEIVADVGSGIQLAPGGQIGIQSGTGNALTFSVYGVVESRAPE